VSVHEAGERPHDLDLFEKWFGKIFAGMCGSTPSLSQAPPTASTPITLQSSLWPDSDIDIMNCTAQHPRLPAAVSLMSPLKSSALSATVYRSPDSVNLCSSPRHQDQHSSCRP
jgi:hypothetical protein